MLVATDGRFSTHTRRMRFSGPPTGVLCKRPFPEFVAKIRIQRQRSSADIYRSCEQNCNRLAAFKNATVRERPVADGRIFPKRTFDGPPVKPPRFGIQGIKTDAPVDLREHNSALELGSGLMGSGR